MRSLFQGNRKAQYNLMLLSSQMSVLLDEEVLHDTLIVFRLVYHVST